jgi:serine/threonine protein phosphatase 1
MPIAIGDIHGCLEPLQRLVETLQRLVEQLPPEKPLVFLGDYIDRGPQSAGVVQYLIALGKRRPCHFLMGNHELLMMTAVVETEAISHWLYNGGTTTLISYGTNQRQWAGNSERRSFLGPHHAFYKALELYWEDQDTIYVHAGVDVGISDMKAQDPETLLWIREKFFRNAHQWRGKQIIFGHTPTRTLGLSGKAIFNNERFYGIDTGCVYGGYLTAMDSRTHQLWQERSTFPPPR